MPCENTLKRLFRRLSRKRWLKGPALETGPRETDDANVIEGKSCRTMTLVDLPSELRLLVYEHFYADLSAYFQLYRYNVHIGKQEEGHRLMRISESTALLRVCRITRVEASPVFWLSFAQTCKAMREEHSMPLTLLQLPHMLSLAMNLQKYTPEAAHEMVCRLLLSCPSVRRFSGKPSWHAESRLDVRRAFTVLRAKGMAVHLSVPWKQQRSTLFEAEYDLHNGIEVLIHSGLMKVEGLLTSLNWEL